ncbi:hypothetical protein HNP11_001413 [Tsukamurella ocularis]|nr:hypothetical protein [Tsukamurella ocularis]MCS3787240.1 hypothetical protein [Tsukamurella ocularis]MCS3852631.1 hypothetical protein [Tsukamurella ocularis]
MTDEAPEKARTRRKWPWIVAAVFIACTLLSMS